jgi:hypothetical protein
VTYEFVNILQEKLKILFSQKRLEEERRKKIKEEATMEQPAIRQTREKCKHKTCRI